MKNSVKVMPFSVETVEREAPAPVPQLGHGLAASHLGKQYRRRPVVHDFRLVANIKNQLRHSEKAYKPMSLKNFSPYEEDWEYENIFDLYHQKGEVIKVYDYYNEPPMTVDQASIELQKAIDRVSLKPKGSITIINCAMRSLGFCPDLTTMCLNNRLAD